MARITYGNSIRRMSSSDVRAVASNLTTSKTPPRWNSEPMYQLPPWGEPLVRINGSSTHCRNIADAGH